jgi:hypothetical protein
MPEVIDVLSTVDCVKSGRRKAKILQAEEEALYEHMMTVMQHAKEETASPTTAMDQA